MVSVILDHWSPNHSSRKGTPIDTLIIHHMKLPHPQGLNILCDGNRPEGRVSAHYYIRRNGFIYQLVSDDRKAWHAGLSEHDYNEDNKITDVEKNLNKRSLGIEIEYQPDYYTEEELESNMELSILLCKKYNIEVRNVLGHKEVAPGRKIDPENFNMTDFRQTLFEKLGN